MSKSSRKQRAAQRAGGGGRQGTDEARVHLPLYGQDREIAFAFRTGPRTLRDLLPAAREISRQIASFARAEAEAEGRQVHLGDTLSAACASLARLPHGGLPLPLALEWAEVHGQRLRGLHDGDAMVLALLEELGSLDREPD